MHPSSLQFSKLPVPRLLEWPSTPDRSPRDFQISSDLIGVWVVELDGEEIEGTDLTIDLTFGAILSDDEIVRAKRFVKPADRVRFARCRSAVRAILGEIEGIPGSLVNFGSGPFGKPFLDSKSPGDIEFNVSHSGELALVAVTRGRAIGVDLEHVKLIREADRIVSTFFTEAEQAQFAAIPEAERMTAFMRGWTRKEAILKGIGRGLAGGPARYETMFGTSPLAPHFLEATPNPIVGDWMLWEVAIGDEYVATLAAAIDRPA